MDDNVMGHMIYGPNKHKREKLSWMKYYIFK